MITLSFTNQLDLFDAIENALGEDPSRVMTFPFVNGLDLQLDVYNALVDNGLLHNYTVELPNLAF